MSEIHGQALVNSRRQTRARQSAADGVRLLVTGSTGIAPLMAMARGLNVNGAKVVVAGAQGACGSRLTRVRNGLSKCRDPFLVSDERARNDAYAPRGSPAFSYCLAPEL